MSVTINPFRAALATNSTATSFVAKAPSLTKPSGAGVIDLLDASLGLSASAIGPKFVQLIPFGTDGSNDTFDMQLWGWSRTALAPSTYGTTAETWIPQLLLELNVVLGNIASPVNSIKAAAQYLADTITIAKGDADAQEISPATDYAGSILCHMRGVQLLEFGFDADAGAQACAGANCLWRLMDQ